MPYHIPYGMALSFVEAPKQGQTKPSYFDCIVGVEFDGPQKVLARGEQVVDTYLLKPTGSPEVSAREVLGNYLAKLCGFETPEPAVVYLSEVLAEHVSTLLRSQGMWASFAPGFCCGCKRFIGANESLVDGLPLSDPSTALRLYIFDMLVGNADRVVRNPNCALLGQKLVVFDFEQAFMLTERDWVDVDTPPWQVASRGLGMAHMYWKELRGKTYSSDMVSRFLEGVDIRKLEALIDQIPDDWRPEGRRVLEHVQGILKARKDFIADIMKSLR